MPSKNGHVFIQMQWEVTRYDHISKDNWMGIAHRAGINNRRDIHSTDIVGSHVGLSGDFQTNRKDDLSEEQMRIYLEIFEQIEKTIYRRYK